MRVADADVYYHNCSECVTGQVALWCRSNHRAFVFSLASDADCDRRLPELHSAYERAFYRYGLRQATTIVAQTSHQQNELRQTWNLHSTIIPMPCIGPDKVSYVPPSGSTRRVLWVGRVCAVKRLELFLDLAEQCPEFKFDLVGPFGEDSYAQTIEARASTISNVIVHGRVPKVKIGDYYRRSSYLCCTSRYEGFPNTFLEAWSHGLPIISLFDPDSLIARLGLGATGTNVESLAAALRMFDSDHTHYARASERARQYFEANHTVEKVIPRMSSLLDEVGQARRANRNTSNSNNHAMA